MNKKIIYLKPAEEITAVIDKLVKDKEREIFLVVPKGAVIAQSLVNLKLLKREATNLKKEITIVSQDPAVERLAKKAQFEFSDSLDETEKGELSEATADAVLKDKMPADDFDNVLREEKRYSPLRMTDIVRGGSPPIGKLIRKKTKLDETEEALEESDEKAGLGFVRSSRLRLAGLGSKIKEIFLRHGSQQGRIKEEDEMIIRKWPATKKTVAARSQAQEEQEERTLAGRIGLPDFSVKIFGLFIVSAIIIAALVFLLILPKADITIVAKREKIPVDLNVIADKSVSSADVTTNIIPAQLVKLEERGSQEFAATGQRQLNDKAKGTITVFNAYSSSPQTLVETTRFISKDGKVFRLTNTLAIPGAKIEEGRIAPSSIDVQVEADQPGASYNIGPSDFTIPGFKGSPKYDAFYGKSKNAMSGGSTEQVRVVTQDDFNNAKEKTWESLRQKIQQELIAQIPTGYKLLDGAMDISASETKSSVEVGGKAENFSFNIKGLASALIFSEADVDLLLKNSLKESLADKKEIRDVASFSYNNIKADIAKGQINFGAQALQEVVWKVNPEELKGLIAGKREGEVQGILLGRPEIQEARFSLSPFWSKKIPKQIEKIHIIVDPVE